LNVHIILRFICGREKDETEKVVNSYPLRDVISSLAKYLRIVKWQDRRVRVPVKIETHPFPGNGLRVPFLSLCKKDGISIGKSGRFLLTKRREKGYLTLKVEEGIASLPAGRQGPRPVHHAVQGSAPQ
jgi:hypothetical protein